MYRRLIQILSGLGLASCTWMSGAIAYPALYIDSDTPPLRQRELRDGNIRVSVRYEGHPERENLGHDGNLHYTILHQDWLGSFRLTDKILAVNLGHVSLQDINNNGTPEVIVSGFSGGAHCCTTHNVYSWNGNDFDKISIGREQLGGGTFKDINGDGKLEYLTLAQPFFYAFSSFAGSVPPSRILSFQDGEFQDVSREHPEQLRSVAWQMYLALQERNHEVNGVLAGYVAQKALLGEFEEGWEFMLAHYDPDDDSGIWGYNIYNEEREVVGKHPDFPTALQAFLLDWGYIEESDLPGGCGRN